MGGCIFKLGAGKPFLPQMAIVRYFVSWRDRRKQTEGQGKANFTCKFSGDMDRAKLKVLDHQQYSNILL